MLNHGEDALSEHVRMEKLHMSDCILRHTVGLVWVVGAEDACLCGAEKAGYLGEPHLRIHNGNRGLIRSGLCSRSCAKTRHSVNPKT